MLHHLRLLIGFYYSQFLAWLGDRFMDAGLLGAAEWCLNRAEEWH